MISLTAEYALRAVIYLVDQQDSSQTVQQIAQATQVPMDYLSKVLQELAKSGIVRSQRGLYGGFHLKSDPHTTTVYDVINAVKPIHRIEGCPLNYEGHEDRMCHLHRLLKEAESHVERMYRGTLISELTGQFPADLPEEDHGQEQVAEIHTSTQLKSSKPDIQ